MTGELDREKLKTTTPKQKVEEKQVETHSSDEIDALLESEECVNQQDDKTVKQEVFKMKIEMNELKTKMDVLVRQNETQTDLLKLLIGKLEKIETVLKKINK